MTLLATAEPKPLYKDPNSPETEGVSGEWRTNRNEDGSEHVLPYPEAFEYRDSRVEVQGADWSVSADRRKTGDLAASGNKDSFHVEEGVVVVARGTARDHQTAAEAGQIAVESIADDLLLLDDQDLDDDFNQAFEDASSKIDNEMLDRPDRKNIVASLIATKIVDGELHIGQAGSGRVGVRHADGSFEWITVQQIDTHDKVLKNWVGGGESILSDDDDDGASARNSGPQLIKYKLQTGDRIIVAASGVAGGPASKELSEGWYANELDPKFSVSEAAERICTHPSRTGDATAVVFDVNPEKPEPVADQLEGTEDDGALESDRKSALGVPNMEDYDEYEDLDGDEDNGEDEILEGVSALGTRRSRSRSHQRPTVAQWEDVPHVPGGVGMVDPNTPRVTGVDLADPEAALLESQSSVGGVGIGHSGEAAAPEEGDGDPAEADTETDEPDQEVTFDDGHPPVSGWRPVSGPVDADDNPWRTPTPYSGPGSAAWSDPSSSPYNTPNELLSDTRERVFTRNAEIIDAARNATKALAELENTPWYRFSKREDARKAYDAALGDYLAMWEGRIDEYVDARMQNGAVEDDIATELRMIGGNWTRDDVADTQAELLRLGGKFAEIQKWYTELSTRKKIAIGVVGAVAMVGGGVVAPVVLAAGAAVTGVSAGAAGGLSAVGLGVARAFKGLAMGTARLQQAADIRVGINGADASQVAANLKEAPRAVFDMLQQRNKKIRYRGRAIVAVTMLGGSLLGGLADAASASMVEASSEVTVGGVPEATSIPLPPDALGGGVPTAVPEAVTVPISPDDLGGAPVAPEAAPTVPPAQTVPLPPDALGGPVVPESTAAPTVPPAVTVPISPGDLGGVETGGGGGPDVGTGTPEAGPSSPETGTAQTVTVEPGDTLWDIAAASLDSGASGADIADRVGDIYEANAGTIGSNPDLIQPGQNLIIPGAELPPVEVPSAELRLDSPAFTIPNGGGVQGMVSGLTGLDVGGPEASRLTGDVAKDLLNSTNPDVKDAFYFDYTKGEIGISNDGPLPPAAREAVLDSIRSHAHLR